jgi:homoserine O-acetyltransferase
MKTRIRSLLVGFATLLLAAVAAHAQPKWPGYKEADWIAKDFRFHTGEVMPQLRIHYATLGDPKNEAVLVLHGTTGSLNSMLSAGYANQMFGPGKPLDANRYFIIIPDAIGHGKSSKPSDGLRTKFPKYNYDDMVDAQYRLVKEGLGITHLRLVTGNSMGGMHTWLWGTKFPNDMDALVPMASQPSEMSSRNWILRRLIVDSITNDPAWNNGNYTTQPRSAQFASVFFAFATSGGDQALYKAAPTRGKADELLDARLRAPFTADANDTLYAWASSADYNASPNLHRIRAALLAINAADDERNPPSTGIMERELGRVKGAKYLLIPASEDTAGHGTTGNAHWYARQLGEWLATVPRGWTSAGAPATVPMPVSVQPRGVAPAPAAAAIVAVPGAPTAQMITIPGPPPVETAPAQAARNEGDPSRIRKRANPYECTAWNTAACSALLPSEKR